MSLEIKDPLLAAGLMVLWTILMSVVLWGNPQNTDMVENIGRYLLMAAAFAAPLALCTYKAIMATVQDE